MAQHGTGRGGVRTLAAWSGTGRPPRSWTQRHPRLTRLALGLLVAAATFVLAVVLIVVGGAR